MEAPMIVPTTIAVARRRPIERLSIGPSALWDKRAESITGAEGRFATDVLLRQRSANRLEPLHGVLHIGMNADRVEGHGNARAVASDDASLFGQQDRLGRSFLHTEKRTGLAAR